MSSYESYQTPFPRYASKEMSFLFSARNRITTWRKLWTWLAESEKSLGLSISDKAIQELKEHQVIADEEFTTAREQEARVRHDVMAHVHTYGLVAPEAAGIIHWGATSCYVTDNADLIFLRDGLDILIPKLAIAIYKMKLFALQYADWPCLGYTHYQPAQPTTVGKRACLWIQDLLMDLRNLERARSDLRFRGVKGTTGSQASFLALFDGNHELVEQLDELVTEKAGFKSAFTISSQTYPRKVDVQVISALSGLGSTFHHIGTNLRLLAHDQEISEPFESEQIGSSAMAYKQNPMRSERLCSLGRLLGNRINDATQTYATQWLERSLDDSAIRRALLPETFLSADSGLIILQNIFTGMKVHKAVITKNLKEQLPFMSTENIIMCMVKDHNESRQEVHERIRKLSLEASKAMRDDGVPNEFLDKIKQTEYFKPIWGKLHELTAPETFIGRCPEQVLKFAGPDGEVEEALRPYKNYIEKAGLEKVELRV